MCPSWDLNASLRSKKSASSSRLELNQELGHSINIFIGSALSCEGRFLCPKPVCSFGMSPQQKHSISKHHFIVVWPKSGLPSHHGATTNTDNDQRPCNGRLAARRIAEAPSETVWELSLLLLHPRPWQWNLRTLQMPSLVKACLRRIGSDHMPESQSRDSARAICT